MLDIMIMFRILSTCNATRVTGSHPAPGLRRSSRISMWKRVRLFVARFRRRSPKNPARRRTDAARARFWAEVRAGEREAEARSRP